MCCFASATAFSERPFTMTRAPSRASPVAMANPMPLVEPETRAVLSVSFRFMMCCFSWRVFQSKSEAVAAEPPEAVMLVRLRHGNTGASSFANFQRRSVAAVHLDRRPLRQDGDRRRRMRGKFIGCVNDLTGNDGQDGFDALDVFLRYGEVIVRERDEIRQLAGSDCALLAGFSREPTAALGVKP